MSDEEGDYEDENSREQSRGDDDSSEEMAADDRIDPHYQNMVDKLLTKDSKKHFDTLEPVDKINVIQSFALVLKRRKQVVKGMITMLLHDPNSDEQGSEYKGVSLEVIVDAYAYMISVLEGTDDGDGSEPDLSGEDAANNLPDHDLCYEKLKDYLGKIVELHTTLDVDATDVLEARRVLLACLRKELGGTWTSEMGDAWAKFTGFVSVSLVARSKKDRVFVPTKNQIKLGLKTWQIVHNNFKLSEEIFFDVLLTKYPELRDVFDNTSSESIIAQFSKALGLINDLDTLIPLLWNLGNRHRELGVKPAMLSKGKVAFMAMLEQCSGALWTGPTIEAWQTLWKFTVGIMGTALQEAWMLHMPPEPCVIRCVIEINHLKEINPANMNFYSDIIFDFWNGSIASQKLAFDNGITNVEKMGGSKAIVWTMRTSNTEKVEDIYKNEDRPKIAKVADRSFWQRGRLQGKFSQFFDLSRYPFDAHSLRFYFEINVPMSQARFEEEDSHDLKVVMSKASKLLGVGGTDWNVYQPSLMVQKTRRDKRNFQRLVVSMPISRRFGNFINQVLLPTLLIDAVAFQVYFLETNPMFYRMNTLVPLLLTLFAFKWNVSGSIPPVPYLTRLDYNFNCSYIFILVHTTVVLLTRIIKLTYGSYTWYLHLSIFGFVLLCYLYARLWVINQCRTAIDEFAESNTAKLINEHEKHANGKRMKKVHKSGTAGDGDEASESSVTNTEQSGTQSHMPEL